LRVALVFDLPDEVDRQNDTHHSAKDASHKECGVAVHASCAGEARDQQEGVDTCEMLLGLLRDILEGEHCLKCGRLLALRGCLIVVVLVIELVAHFLFDKCLLY